MSTWTNSSSKQAPISWPGRPHDASCGLQDPSGFGGGTRDTCHTTPATLHPALPETHGRVQGTWCTLLGPAGHAGEASRYIPWLRDPSTFGGGGTREATGHSSRPPLPVPPILSGTGGRTAPEAPSSTLLAMSRRPCDTSAGGTGGSGVLAAPTAPRPAHPERLSRP